MRALFLALGLSIFAPLGFAQECPSLSPVEQARSIDRNLLGGIPTDGEVLVRRGYVAEYDAQHRTPRWVAWRALPSYRKTPRRDGRWSSFRADPDVPNPVVTRDYNGLYASADNFARGHLAPYFISGGDRDGDGLLAAGPDGETPLDIDDQCAVYEFNYMTNIAPQYHRRFNGFERGEGEGLWYQLETQVRAMVDSGRSFQIIAGSIYGGDGVQFVGPEGDIGVPDMFYKVVIGDEGPVAFLFTHRRQLDGNACPLEAELADCIVPFETIESLTGLDLLRHLPDPIEHAIEQTDGRQLWAEWTTGH